ncbi:MAG: zf-HC2 domain-containing protein [Vicinamibacterales bacterium]
MCDERDRLIGYVYGECDSEEQALIDRHLEDCHVCRDEIRGLRRTREDLLAWDVPEHRSVWTPFVPAVAPPPPWYRQVPAWAMAAAASVMFVAGAAGGAATHAFLAPDPGGASLIATGATTQPARPTSAVPVSLSDADLARIVAAVRAQVEPDFDTRLAAVSAQAAERRVVPAAVGPGADAVRDLREAVASLRADSNRHADWILSLTSEVGDVRKSTAREFERIGYDQSMRALLTSSTAGSPGGR